MQERTGARGRKSHSQAAPHVIWPSPESGFRDSIAAAHHAFPMDPLTHASLGTAAAMAVAGRTANIRHAAVAGFAAGLLPDIDIFFRAADDPLGHFRWHRHFTHSFAFSPIIAATGAALAWLILIRRKPRYRDLLVPALAGGISHILNDAGTSYGTLLFWPFVAVRDAWDILPIVDPVFLTLPLLTLAVAAVVRRSRVTAHAALAWMAAYAALGLVQHTRAEHAVREHAREQGHTVERVKVNPAPLSLLLWRGTYAESGNIRAVAVRPGFTGTKLWPGDTVREAVPGRDGIPLPGTPAGDAVLALQNFTRNWLGASPRPDGHLLIGDARFATLPQSATPLWGVTINPADPSEPPRLAMNRRGDDAPYRTFFGMILDNENAPKSR